MEARISGLNAALDRYDVLVLPGWQTIGAPSVTLPMVHGHINADSDLDDWPA